MAKAPRPTHSKEQAELEASQSIVTITINRDLHSKGRPIPQVHRIGILNVPMRERIICRKATGLPFSAFWAEDRIDIDSLMVLWWIARRLQGDVTLTFDQAAEEWPENLDVENEIELEMSSPDEDDDESDPDDPES